MMKKHEKKKNTVFENQEIFIFKLKLLVIFHRNAHNFSVAFNRIFEHLFKVNFHCRKI